MRMHMEELYKAIVRLIDEKESRGYVLTDDDKILLSTISVEYPHLTKESDDNAFKKWIWRSMVTTEATVALADAELKDARRAAYLMSPEHEDEMHKMIEEKEAAFSRLKQRMYDAMLEDKEMCEALRRKWMELCRTPQPSSTSSSS